MTNITNNLNLEVLLADKIMEMHPNYIWDYFKDLGMAVHGLQHTTQP